MRIKKMTFDGLESLAERIRKLELHREKSDVKLAMSINTCRLILAQRLDECAEKFGFNPGYMRFCLPLTVNHDIPHGEIRIIMP